jgi:hypothetical protein
VKIGLEKRISGSSYKIKNEESTDTSVAVTTVRVAYIVRV